MALLNYRVGQKVRSKIYIRCYRKNRMNFLANPIDCIFFRLQFISSLLHESPYSAVRNFLRDFFFLIFIVDNGKMLKELAKAHDVS